MIRLSRGIIKLARRGESSLEDYRYYVIARHHYALRSGIFSLDEFCNILHSEYDYASLHRKPGNDRTRFKKRLIEILQNSPLFDLLLDGRYKANSESGLLSRYNRGHNKTMWFQLPDKKILSSKKEFFDFCVGCLVAGGRFQANKKVAESCGVTVRRIQFATSRNNKNKTFIKRYNFVEDFSGTSKDVEKFRAILFNVHGISSPLPRKYKKEWVVRLNAPNTYRANTMYGVKGDRVHPMSVQVSDKGESWFIPAFETDRAKLTSDYSDDKRWHFNDGIYSFDSYVQDNSKYMS